MILYLVRIRFLQLYRGAGDIGLFRFLFLAVVIFPLIAIFLVQKIAVHPWPFILPGLVVYIIWLIHGKRKDYHFLVASERPPRLVFLGEYLLFTIPVTTLLLSAALYIHALFFCTVLVLIALIVPLRQQNFSRTMKLQMIPSGMFEWQSGIRKNLVILVLFYLPGLFGFYQVWLSAVSLLFLTMIFISFYSEYEPRNMLSASNCASGQFLARKVLKHTGRFALLLLPLFLIALIHNDYRWISLGYFLASLNLLVFSILLKYYQYRPSAYSGAHQVLTSLACIISVILPVASLLVVFNIFLAAGACRNLKSYLDDRH